MDFRPQDLSSSIDASARSRAFGMGSFSLRSRIKKTKLAVYSRQLASLLKAGVPIVQALNVLLRQERKGVLAEVIKYQIAELEGGSSYSQTLHAFPGIFDKMYISLIIAGEKAGVMDRVMSRLAYYLERSVKTAAKIRSAMTYPIVVLCASVLIVSALLIFVVPQFEEIFQSMLQGAALPAMTRWVMGISQFFQTSWVWIFVAAIGLYWLGFFLLRIPLVCWGYDRAKFMIPSLGELLKKSTMARFCRTLGTLLESAVPILDAIDTATKTLSNRVLEEVFERVRSKVRDGESVAASVENEPIIPPMLAGMIEVGEATGELPSMLIQVAETYEQEVEIGVDGLTTLIEPVMILLLALVIGFLVIALFLPIVEIMQQLGT